MSKLLLSVIHVKYVRTLIVLILLSLPFAGSDCQQITNTSGGGSIIGQWRLVYNAGTNHDICPGEEIIFSSDGIAQLKCPDQTIKTRHYTITNSILTYTETSIEYTIKGLSANQMELTGYNRDLYYDKVVTTDINKNTESGTGTANSSEKGNGNEK